MRPPFNCKTVLVRSVALWLMSLQCGLVVAQNVPADPADAARPYLSIFTHPDYAARPQEAALVRAVQGGELLRFAQSSHFKHYTSSDPIYRDRFSTMFPTSTFPIVCVQRSDGAYWYKASGNRVPTDGRQLLDEIKYYVALDPQLNPSGGTAESGLKTQIGYEYEQCGPDGCPPRPDTWLPNVNPQLPDSSDFVQIKTPVRDSMASGVSTLFAVLACGFLLFVLVVSAIVLFLVRPK
ncbi:hypothetical protein [Aureliella helgolandensis]|uniref:Uncharacterized protein n=1 Tax=Aureliella helgolandensis TaxID=2527968 RepID=A0A518GEA1_9BACT|nr:hypothetical protein [Aureliella helgolandensis]QDV26923.1 hypothetical protein Q31a_53030 [Aureliella helgolandensis]